MSRDDLDHGDLRLADDPEEEFEPALAVAQMKMEDAGLAAEHAPDPALGREPCHLVKRRLGGAVIAHGDLAGADDLVDDDEVGADASRQGADRDLIGPRVDEGRNALDLEGPGLGQKGGHVAGDAVGPQAADDGRDAARDDVLDPDLGGARRRPAFASASQEVNVGIDEPGEDAFPGRVHGLDFEAVDPDAARFGHGLDRPSGEQDVLPAERLGREDLSSADQSDHGGLLDLVTGPKLARLSGVRKRARVPKASFEFQLRIR